MIFVNHTEQYSDISELANTVQEKTKKEIKSIYLDGEGNLKGITFFKVDKYIVSNDWKDAYPLNKCL